MSTGLQLDTVFSGDGLINTTPLGQQIAARAEVVQWWQADGLYAALESGAISALVAKKGVGTFAQATAGYRPALTADRIGGYPAAVFDGVDDKLAFSVTAGGTQPDFTQPFSIVAIAKAAVTASGTQQIVSSYNGVNIGTALSVVSGADQARLAHGNGQVVAPYTRGTAALIIGASDTTTIGIEVNGTQATRVATNNAAGTVTAAIGALNSAGSQLLTGELSDLMFLNVDVLAEANASLLSLIRQFAYRVYGVGVAA